MNSKRAVIAKNSKNTLVLLLIINITIHFMRMQK